MEKFGIRIAKKHKNQMMRRRFVIILSSSLFHLQNRYHTENEIEFR